VAARGNFCTVDEAGRITDRRAGRIATEKTAPICAELARIELPGVQVFVEPVRDHRFLLVLRGEGLSDRVSETDPQREGVEPLPARALAAEAEPTAKLFNDFIAQARGVLASHAPANMLTLRGIAKHPPMPSIVEACKFRAAAIAAYPMYRGLAKLVGMDVLATGATFADEIETLKQHWDAYDFFFLHYKPADAASRRRSARSRRSTDTSTSCTRCRLMCSWWRATIRRLRSWRGTRGIRCRFCFTLPTSQGTTRPKGSTSGRAATACSGRSPPRKCSRWRWRMRGD
jgi:2,3-diphosphopglycerate-independent phosphoglycerate mutase